LSKAHSENLETLIKFLLSYRREIRDEIIATTEESGFKMQRCQFQQQHFFMFSGISEAFEANTPSFDPADLLSGISYIL
jgi:hypothetical protein